MNEMLLAVKPKTHVPVFDAASPEFAAIVADLRAQSARRDAERIDPKPVFKALAAIGFGAARLPKNRGGGGISIAELFELVHELARADSNVAHAFRNHFGWVEGIIKPDLIDGNAEWFELVLSGNLFSGSFHENSDQPAGTASFKTSLKAVPGGYLLNGDKAYSTGNLFADWLVVSVADDEGQAVSVTIPADREGISHLDDWDGIGQRLSGSGTTRYTDVFIQPREVNRAARAIRTRPYGSAFNQLWLTTVVAGILQAAVEDTADFVRQRKRNYYHGLADLPRDDPGVQQSFGELAANAFVATAAVKEAARVLDRAWNSGGGVDIDEAVAMQASLAALQSKVVIDAVAQQTSSALLDVGGATAATARSQLDRHWRNIRTLISHNPRFYKARYLGNYLLNGTLLPNSSYF
ncbi:acyl-CoA dehydrogenase family protein [Brucella pituitosa]|uniref:acyl-CoA dehydrogenase family protein n=1 Tax=Brucella pituitosa TaxID=571256 RepID=UPI000CFF080A|nr:acyl-CoA dehydrogenase [Ochrobactrum sp. MYb68]